MAGTQPLKPRSETDTPVVHPKVLTRLHDYLVSHINFDSLHDQLISGEAFDDITLSDMKEESKSSGRIRFLLAVLKKSDLETYAIFKNGLEKTKQGHIVERLVAVEKEVGQQLESEKRQMQSRANIPPKQLQLEIPGNQRDVDGDNTHLAIAQPASTFDGSLESSIHSIKDKD